MATGLHPAACDIHRSPIYMANIVCSKCAANNPEPGHCILCGARLGSYKRAVWAALLATLSMTAMWIILSVVVRMQFPIIAGIFGATVSFCVLHFSGGSGLFFQLIASGFTLAGIVLADSASLLLLAVVDEKIPLSSLSTEWLWVDMSFRISNDPYTILYYVLGLISGLFLLRGS